MKHTFLTLILALMAVTSFAQVPVLTAGGHLPRGGDRIERYCIDYVLPGDSGRNVLWDKSGLHVGKETLVSAYKYWSDSTFSEVVAGRVQYNYTISGDTVLLSVSKGGFLYYPDDQTYDVGEQDAEVVYDNRQCVTQASTTGQNGTSGALQQKSIGNIDVSNDGSGTVSLGCTLMRDAEMEI